MTYTGLSQGDVVASEMLSTGNESGSNRSGPPLHEVAAQAQLAGVDQDRDHGTALLVDPAHTSEVFKLIREARVDLAFLERFYVDALDTDPEGGRAVALVAETARWVHLHARKVHHESVGRQM